MRRWIGLFTVASAIGCGGSGSGDGSPGDDPAGEATYYEDVAPILQKHCVACHTEGSIAPFALQTYESARTVAGAMKIATANRTMPPFHVDASGACNQYRDARVLDESEIATIARWVDAHAPEGDTSHAPAPADPPPKLDQVDATLDPNLDYAPDAGLSDDYRCFIVDPGLTADRFLTAYEVHPGQPSEVHHVVVVALDTPEDDAMALSLDDADPGPGYQCFGGSGTASARTVVGWAPGTGVTRYPAGTGLRLMGGRKVVMQVHYNLSAGASPDRTRVDLTLAPSVEKEATITGVGDFDLNIAPGQEHAVESASAPFALLPASVVIHGVFPHMHRLGRSLRVDVERGGTSRCVVDVPDYQFGWQQFYFYEQPFVLEAGGPGSFGIQCGYDTQEANTTVHWGEGTGDEMCLAGFYVTL